MTKTFERGDPEGEMAVLNNAIIRAAFERDADALQGLYPEGWELFDLVNGEVEMVVGEDVFRCYTVPVDVDYRGLVIDDYHPDDDANLEVDEVGNVLNPGDEDG